MTGLFASLERPALPRPATVEAVSDPEEDPFASASHSLSPIERPDGFVPPRWRPLLERAIAGALPIGPYPALEPGRLDLNVAVRGAVTILRLSDHAGLRAKAKRDLEIIQTELQREEAASAGRAATTRTVPAVYTAGYGNRSMEALITSAAAVNGHVVDIRLNPASKREEWCEGYLRARLRGRYTHCRALGNRNYRGQLGRDAGVVFEDLASGLDAVVRVIESGCSPILLCGCGDPVGCHRTAAGTHLEELGFVTKELTWIA